MRLGVVNVLTALLVFLVLLVHVSAVTYLESLAVTNRQHRPSNTHSTANVATSLLVGRQAAGDLSNLYSCQNISVNAPFEDQSCVLGLLGIGLICTPITRDISVINLACICASAGKITPATTKTLDDFIRNPSNNNTASQLYLLTSFRNGKVAYTATSLLSYLSGSLPNELSTKTTPCKYPSGAVPSCGAACAYDCPADTRLCGTTCLTIGRACVSNMPVRRSLRDTGQVELDFRCPSGKTACALPQAIHGGSVFISDRIECIDTMGDIESCGGCAFPLPGRKGGIDCTAIPHAGHVSCQSGSCHIHTCRPGYSLNGTDCIPIPARRQNLYRNQPSSSAIVEEPTKPSETKLDVKTAPATDLHPTPLSELVTSAEAAKVKKTAGKKVLAQRQLTTKQLIERKEKHRKRKSRWAVMFD